MVWGGVEVVIPNGQNVQGTSFLSNTMLNEERKDTQHEIYGTQKSEDNNKACFRAKILEIILCSETPCLLHTRNKAHPYLQSIHACIYTYISS